MAARPAVLLPFFTCASLPNAVSARGATVLMWYSPWVLAAGTLAGDGAAVAEPVLPAAAKPAATKVLAGTSAVARSLRP